MTMHNRTIRQENLQNFISLQQNFVSKRIPATGSINLTQRCNMDCVHCYLGAPASEFRSAQDELDTEQWLSIIDQITEAGCLHLLFSGGEVLLRPDFEIIYKKAIYNGLLVTVFTNGTLINNTVLSLFEDLPPQVVEISLYGARAKSYETITRVKGSFEKCLAGIRSLYERKIKFKLKTMILAQNSGELADIKNIASGFGVDFVMDPAISACLDGDRAPLVHRVDAADAVRADFADPDNVKRWQDYFLLENTEPVSDFLYNCGAGLSHFHIDPAGTLLPCMMLTKPAFDLTKGNFMEGWRNEIHSIRKIKAGSSYRCNQCDKNKFCSTCPAFFELENGSAQKHSQYLCDLAENRLKTIKEKLHIDENPMI